MYLIVSEQDSTNLAKEYIGDGIGWYGFFCNCEFGILDIKSAGVHGYMVLFSNIVLYCRIWRIYVVKAVR
jgi:small ligand-binding sensory domain FIST